MPISPTTYFGKERVFVDREACTEAFRKNVQNYGTREYNVLFYHGIAGIGKSKLQKELQSILDEEYPEILWAAIDLNTKTYREVGTFLITLRNKIQEKCKAKFYLFNTAHAIYWKKLHPEIPLPKESYPLIKESGFFKNIIDVLDQYGPARLTWDIINNVPDSVMRFFKEQAIDIDILSAMEAHELEKLLPGFFATDFTSYLGKDKKAYIFIDTYEALWEDLRNRGSFHEKDEWIRENLIPNMLGVSWVICGRENLHWVSECDPDWEMYLEQHSVDELPESYCKEFLEDCGIENKEIQAAIIKASEGVPYYLNLSVDTFEKIRKKTEPVLEDFGKTQPEIFNRFVRYLDISEIRALEVLSAPNFWDRDLFEILMKQFDSGFPIRAFSELIKFSFIKMDTNGRFSIHQLMRKSLQEHQAKIDRKSTHEFLLAYYGYKIIDIEIQAIFPEHEIALTEAFYHAKESMEAEDLLNWLIIVSDPFSRAAFWKLITPMYEDMLQILEAKHGPEHPDVAAALNKLSKLYDSMGEYEKALPRYKRALEIREKVLGQQHPAVAVTLNNLAALYRQMGEYEKALPLYQRSLEINERLLDSQHPSVAAALNNLADLYRQMGEYEKALPLCQRALEIYERILAPQNPDIAGMLNNFAGLYESMGEYEKALPIYQRASKIFEEMLGQQHPSVAISLNNLAGLYVQIGEYEKALPLYQRTLEIYEKMLHPEHPFTAVTLSNLATLYNKIGEYEKALPLYQRTLEIYGKVLGPQHPNFAVTLNNIAALYENMGDYEKALPLFQRALNIREKVLGSQHPDVATTLNNIADLYKIIGNYKKALPLFQRALNIREKVLGSQHPDVATTLNNLASLYHEVDEYEKALPLYQRALGIYEKMLGSQHPNIAATLNNIADLYRQIGEYEKALPLFQKALEIDEKVLGEEHPSVAMTLNNIASLCGKIGRNEEAFVLFERAFDIAMKKLGPEHPNTVMIGNNFIKFISGMEKGKAN